MPGDLALRQTDLARHLRQQVGAEGAFHLIAGHWYVLARADPRRRRVPEPGVLEFRQQIAQSTDPSHATGSACITSSATVRQPPTRC